MSKTYTPEELKKLPFMNENLNTEERVEDLLNRLELKEKFKLCAGRHRWETKPIKRLGIKPFLMTDGPHGVAPHSSNNKECTYFPVGICRGATWNPKLSERFGEAIAQEVRDIGSHMILGPGVNIVRTPLCGRTFEYQTEDPYLNKELAISVVKGVQSQRIAACIKHYICNNQEKNRFTYSAEVDEKALEEIYYPAFKAAVKDADVWSVMGSYNKINGTYGCAHKKLLRDVLMDKWGFKGFIVSDWNATKPIENPEDCIKAGLSLEMPRTYLFKKKNLEKAYSEGKFTEEILDENVRRLLRVMFLVGLFDSEDKIPKGSRNTEEHQLIAREIAAEGIVLLKNQNDILPLNIEEIENIAVLGPNADVNIDEGGGSSSVRPPYNFTPLNGIEEKIKGKITLVKSVSEADIVILVVGLNHEPHMDAENWDKLTLKLPEEQINLINETVKTNKNTIVLAINGSPITMEDWIDKVPALIEAWYPGQEGGRVIADILFGDINPSGKLPITFPKKLDDSPAHISEKRYSDNEKIYYEESIYVGYRYFDTEDIDPLFPFGFGLSYTKFKFDDLEVNKTEIQDSDTLQVKFKVENIGKMNGAEVTQLYISNKDSTTSCPKKELKRFKKVHLEAGETKTITFELNVEDFSYYDPKIRKWKVDEGEFQLLIGNSSRNILLESNVQFVS